MMVLHPLLVEAMVRARQEDLQRSWRRSHRCRRDKVFAPPAPRGRVCGYPFGQTCPTLPPVR